MKKKGLSPQSRQLLEETRRQAQDNATLRYELAQMRSQMNQLIAMMGGASAPAPLPPVAVHHATPSPKPSSSPSVSSPSSSISSSSSSSTSARSSSADLLAQRDRLQAELAAAEEALKQAERVATERAAAAPRRTVDVVFVVDCTASMDPWIEATRAKLVEILAEVERQLQGKANVRVRVAFVGYRDFDGVATEREWKRQYEIEPLTDDVELVRAFVGRIEPSGGGDSAEDVFGGLQLALGLDWRADARVIIHFADAPGHGALYNGGCWDNHDHLDADGSLGRQIVRDMVAKRVHYYFGQIKPDTRAMTDQLCAYHLEATMLSSAGPEAEGSAPAKLATAFEVLEMGAQPTKFLEKCVYAITTSITSSISAHHSTTTPLP